MKKYLLIIIIIIAMIGIYFYLKEPNFGNTLQSLKTEEYYEQTTGLKAKYQLRGNSLERIIKNDLKDRIKVVIGDEKKLEGIITDFEPSLEINRWDEVKLKIKPKENGILGFDKDKILIKTAKMDYEMFETNEGYKYIWYLNEKPLTNKVEFLIETQGLNFFYQPSLTQEYQNGYNQEFQKEIIVSETQVKDLDGNVLVERPENVVGSYAVYHQTKGGMNDAAGKDYKAGKAFHIYRPKIIDSNGLETWGILHIENGIYSVEIPQVFLDTAVYPIKSNDTFGYTTAGAGYTDIYSNNIVTTTYRNGTSYNLSVAGSVSKLTASILGASQTGTLDIYGFINTEDTIDNTHDEQGEKMLDDYDAPDSNQFWLDITFDSPISLVADDYILSIGGDNASASPTIYRLYYDVTGSQNYYLDSNTGNGSLPTGTPWSEVATGTGRNYSIYATYTPSGGAAIQEENIIIFE